MTNINTEVTIAEWMLLQLDKNVHLYQEQVVYDIQKKFGDDFVYTNESGNLAISKKVLKEFKKITADEVIWERGEKMWRRRKEYDNPGRQQDWHYLAILLF